MINVHCSKLSWINPPPILVDYPEGEMESSLSVGLLSRLRQFQVNLIICNERINE